MDQSAWKIAGDAVLLCRSWDGEHVVYHPAAGDTHLLGEAAVQVLALLQAHPADCATLAQTVAQFCNAQEQHEVGQLTDRMLDDLESLGLIEQTRL